MSGTSSLVAPVAGVVAAVPVQVGDVVAEGDPVVDPPVHEDGHSGRAESAGKVVEILVEEGEEVELGATLARIEAS